MTPVAWVDVQRTPRQSISTLRFFNGSEEKSPTYTFHLDRDFDELTVNLVKLSPIVICSEHSLQYTDVSAKLAADPLVILQLKTTKFFKFTGMNKQTCVAGAYVRFVVDQVVVETSIL